MGPSTRGGGGGFGGGGGEQGRGAGLPRRAVECGEASGHARCPIRGCGPAIIHHQQERPWAFALRPRAPNGACEAEDQQGGGGQAHQQHPPGGAGGAFLGHWQVAQQFDRRKALRARLRGRDAQQPIEKGQAEQRQQQPGCCENDHAGARPCHSARSAVSGRASVRWVEKLQPSPPAISAKPARWAASRAA